MKKMIVWFSKFEILKDFSISTKCNWILHGIVDFPKCIECGKKLGINITIFKNYPQRCTTCNRKSSFISKRRVATFKKHVEMIQIF